MPFPFTLPTTSAFSFSAAVSSPSHPSLAPRASTSRNVVRDALKSHKRLPTSAAQSANLPTVAAAVRSYLPYLLAVVDGGLRGQPVAGEAVDVDLLPQPQPQQPQHQQGLTLLPPLPGLDWRPTLSSTSFSASAASSGQRRLVVGGELARVKLASLEHEVAFLLSTLAMAQSNAARAALHPLQAGSNPDAPPPGPEQRTAAVASASRSLLDAGACWAHAAARLDAAPAIRIPALPATSQRQQATAAAVAAAVGAAPPEAPVQLVAPPPPPCVDVAAPLLRALAALALAEATLLVVYRDDPYPAAVARDRSAADREWMFKAPDLPKVKAHLFARLCLAAAEHAATAAAGLQAAAGAVVGGGGAPGVDEALVRYVADLRRASRAKACRFFGIDADLGGQTGSAIGWLHAGMAELGVDVSRRADAGASGKKKGGGIGLGSRLKKEWSERKEDKKVEREDKAWGGDGGRLEELRVQEMLEAKWVKINDTVSLPCYFFPLPVPTAHVVPRPPRLTGVDEHATDTRAWHAALADAVRAGDARAETLRAAGAGPGRPGVHAGAADGAGRGRHGGTENRRRRQLRRRGQGPRQGHPGLVSGRWGRGLSGGGEWIDLLLGDKL